MLVKLIADRLCIERNCVGHLPVGSEVQLLYGQCGKRCSAQHHWGGGDCYTRKSRHRVVIKPDADLGTWRPRIVGMKCEVACCLPLEAPIDSGIKDDRGFFCPDANRIGCNHVYRKLPDQRLVTPDDGVSAWADFSFYDRNRRGVSHLGQSKNAIRIYYQEQTPQKKPPVFNHRIAN